MYVIEFPFNKIVRLYSTAYYRLFWGCRLFKGVLKILENVQEKLCYGAFKVFKLQPPTLPCMLLTEITCAVEFLFTETALTGSLTGIYPRSFNNVRCVEED